MAESRRVPVPPVLVTKLRHHLEQFGEGPQGLVFHRSGRPFDHDMFGRNVWDPARAKVFPRHEDLALDDPRQPKLSRLRRHDLRHAACSWWLARGRRRRRLPALVGSQDALSVPRHLPGRRSRSGRRRCGAACSEPRGRSDVGERAFTSNHEGVLCGPTQGEGRSRHCSSSPSQTSYQSRRTLDVAVVQANASREPRRSREPTTCMLSDVDTPRSTAIWRMLSHRASEVGPAPPIALGFISRATVNVPPTSRAGLVGHRRAQPRCASRLAPRRERASGLRFKGCPDGNPSTKEALGDPGYR